MEGGRKTVEAAREQGVSAATLYAWKSKYAGMQVSDARRLRQREEQNRRLKHDRDLRKKRTELAVSNRATATEG